MSLSIDLSESRSFDHEMIETGETMEKEEIDDRTKKYDELITLCNFVRGIRERGDKERVK